MKRIDVCCTCGKDIFEGDKVWYEIVSTETGDDEIATCDSCEQQRTIEEYGQD